nr:hypothetical protein [Polyangiaceae bacterium]
EAITAIARPAADLFDAAEPTANETVAMNARPRAFELSRPSFLYALRRAEVAQSLTSLSDLHNIDGSRIRLREPTPSRQGRKPCGLASMAIPKPFLASQAMPVNLVAKIGRDDL